jgi:RNA polymerase sigma-70 factor (ECF subfamily)
MFDRPELAGRWAALRSRVSAAPQPPATVAPRDPLDVALDGARDGDQEAFRQLFRAVQPGLLNYLRALVGETDADDVASDAWGGIARDLGSFHGDGKAFRAWATTIARHRAIDHLRRQRPSVPLPVETWQKAIADDDVEREVLDGLDTATALAMIAALPPDQAQAILLRVVVGLDATAAGQVLGKRPGAIRTAAHRGLRNLADRLDAAASRERLAATPRQVGS